MNPVTGTVDLLKFPSHIILIITQFFLIYITVYSGVVIKTEAGKISKIISRNLHDSNDYETVELNKLLTQIQTRNLKIENVFFVLDWNLIMNVSLAI